MILSILRLTVIVNLSTSGSDLLKTQQETQYYHLQNMELKDQYLYNASYHTIAQKAAGMGYTERR